MEAYERVRQMLKETGVTQKEFAAKVGLSTPATSAMLRGNSSVSEVLANAIELKFNYKADWVLHGEDPKFTEQKETKVDPFDRMVLERLAGWQSEEDQKLITEINFLYKHRSLENLRAREFEVFAYQTGTIDEFANRQKKYASLFQKRLQLFSRMRNELSREEYLWFLLTLHYEDNGEAAKECHWLKKFNFPSSLPKRIRDAIDQFQEVQSKIDRIWTDM